MTAPENVLATTGWISDLGVKGLVPALLLAGHVLSDFTIHRRSKAQDGSDAAVRIVHGVLTVAIFFALLVPFLSWLTAVAAATIGILHLVIDAYRAPLCARIGSVRAELLDQGLHLIILGFVWWCLADLTPTLFAVDETTARSIIVVAVGISAYAFVWNGGNELVIAVFADLRPRALEDQHFIDPQKADPGRGRIIGMLERILILTLVLVNQWAAIALILTAKSIARFKELGDRRFSEYYLIGTLTSVAIAAGTGLLVRLLV